jgi:hypothetical protein
MIGISAFPTLKKYVNIPEIYHLFHLFEV